VIVEETLVVAESMYTAWHGSQSARTIRSDTIGGFSVSFAVPSSEDIPLELIRAAPFRRKVFGVA
jgi:hypothetical protein